MATRAQKAIQRNMSYITESSIDPKNLATILYSNSVISNVTFKTITDRVSGMTNQERMLELMKSVSDAAGVDEVCFKTLVTVLADAEGSVENKVAEKLEEAYDNGNLPEAIVLDSQ